MKAAVAKRLKKKKKHQFDHTDFIGKVTAAGLVTSAYLSIQKDEIYVRVGATHERSCIQADNINFPTPLDEEIAVRVQADYPIPIEPMKIPERTPPEDGKKRLVDSEPTSTSMVNMTRRRSWHLFIDVRMSTRGLGETTVKKGRCSILCVDSN